MTERKKTCGKVNKNEPLPIPSSAYAVHLEIVKLLKELNRLANPSCISMPFLQAWKEQLVLFERYQFEISSASSLHVACAKGCSACCGHWVDEVYSFEGEMIADFLKKKHNDKIPSIADRCREDTAVLDQLKGLVEEKISATAPGEAEAERIDAQDLLLSVFYQMNRPCPLLDRGVCSIYEVRPLTCRKYVSFSDPRFCRPESINEGEAATYLFGLENDALELLETLHKKYAKFDGEYGLRALLLKYLGLF
jgi:Fe-S-cluster containining protein